MYKCTECGCITENKPDFCECGNDKFILIEGNTVEISPVKLNKPGFSFTEKFNFHKNLPSVVIFAICMILSVFALIFLEIPQSEKTTVSENTLQEKKDLKKIEDIWVQSKAKVVVPEAEPQVAKENISVLPTEIKKPSVLTVSNVPKVTKPVQVAAKSKNTVLPQKNQIKVNSKTNNQNTVKQQSPKPATVNKPAPAAQNRSVGNIQNTTKTQQNTSVQTQNPPVPVVQAPPVTDYKALNAYKISLRDVISSKIDFKSVAGDGSCKVSFSVNSSGYPVNKTFTVKSTNPLLNNAVAAAFNNLNVVPTPPNFYSGEKFTLSVYLKDGKFSVSLN